MIIPKRLQMLIENGFWPNKENISQQNCNCIIDFNLIKHIIPEEETVYFFNPPFITIKRLIDRGDSFYLSNEVNKSLDEIDESKTVIIADFGIGADAELALDYSKSSYNPSVIRLKWIYDHENNIKWAKWVKVSKNFDEFVRLTGLSESLNYQKHQSTNDKLQLQEYILE